MNPNRIKVRNYHKERQMWAVKIPRAILHFCLISVGFVMVMPFLWMLSTSLKFPNEIFSYPPTWIPNRFRFENYVDVFTLVPFGQYYINSIMVALSVTSIVLVSSSLAAFAFSRLNFRGRDTLFMTYLATLMIPFPVLLIPNFLIVREFGWYDTYMALILPPAFSAIATFLYRQAFKGIPKELDDAARIDGASSWRIWWHVIMPNAGPVTAALGIFTFLGNWNEFLWPLVVTNSSDMRTIPVGLSSFQGQYNVRWELLMSAAVIALLPVVIVYLLAQKWIIRGVTISGMGGR
jgi:multiple sugar transport system permease protein|tara:strand:- start:3119 stop:3994 length:876 start_codon:yes stop_codon:yes gene_type:complete